MAERSSQRRRRGGSVPMLLGLVVFVALVAAYLSDCLPGLGPGGRLGTPTSDAPAAPKSPQEAAGEASASTITLVVQGEQCRRGQADAEPCDRLCASLDRTRAAATEITLDATEGRHGTVQALRKCLQEAGFSRVRVLSE